MRNFLPIKGPGGRNLTGKEKIALLILVVTLLLCVLTLVAGEKAYLLEEAPNPIFLVVAAFASALGGGIVALYALIMVWSALIYLKGERIADITPLVGRCAAAFAVTIGISGALGIAHLEAAGGLGELVGRALGNTFGAGAGFPILILLMLLGAHLASQGAWTALRQPMMPALATVGGTLAPVGYGFGLAEAPESRLQDGPPLPDDGDPTADERSLAVQQAVAEIERSQGVTIVDVEPAAVEQHEEDEEEAEGEGEDAVAEAEAVSDGTRSIGDEVHEAPEPGEDTEEAEVQRGLAAVAHALEVTRSARDEDVEDEDEQAEAEAEVEVEYGSVRHGLVPVPVGEQDATAEATADAEEDDEEEDEDEFAEVEQYDEDEDYETAEDEDEDVDEFEDEDVDEDECAQDDEELEEDEEADEDEGEYAEDEEDEEEEEDYEGEYAAEDDAEEDEDADEVDEEDGEPEQLELFTEERGDATALDEEEAEELEDEDEADEPVLEALPPEPEPESVREPEPEPADSETDPYAQGGLLRRLQARGPQSSPDGDRPHTAFDWRGRPIK